MEYLILLKKVTSRTDVLSGAAHNYQLVVEVILSANIYNNPESNYNPEMVDIDPAFEDAALLQELLEEHVDCTGSKVASLF